MDLLFFCYLGCYTLERFDLFGKPLYTREIYWYNTLLAIQDSIVVSARLLFPFLKKKCNRMIHAKRWLISALQIFYNMERISFSFTSLRTRNKRWTVSAASKQQYSTLHSSLVAFVQFYPFETTKSGVLKYFFLQSKYLAFTTDFSKV